MAAAMPWKSVEWLQEELESSGGSSLLLLDCRAHELFESSHIETAINLAIPGLMLRRLKKGNLPIRSIIPNNEDKERFVKRCKADTVLLYDEATAEWQQDTGAPTSVLGLLLQKLRDDGCKAFYLKGTLGTTGRGGQGSQRRCPAGEPPAFSQGRGGVFCAHSKQPLARFPPKPFFPPRFICHELHVSLPAGRVLLGSLFPTAAMPCLSAKS